MSSCLLAICSIGLIVAFVVLVHNINKYFLDQMRVEMKRLKFMFATFVFSYILRSLYQIGLIFSLYRELITSLVNRWYLIDTLPFLWDISSILSILILHYLSFRDVQKIPQAGHFNKSSRMPSYDTSTILSSDDGATTTLHLQQIISDTPTSPSLNSDSASFLSQRRTLSQITKQKKC